MAQTARVEKNLDSESSEGSHQGGSPSGSPVVQFARKGKRYIKPVDLFGIAYTWDPKPAGKAKDVKPLCDITTYHTYGYYGFFKPSIAEVLAQIPASIWTRWSRSRSWTVHRASTTSTGRARPSTRATMSPRPRSTFGVTNRELNLANGPLGQNRSARVLCLIFDKLNS